MTARQFFDLVARMRAAQRDYFMTRHHEALKRSKTLERAVDDEVRRVQVALGRHEDPYKPTTAAPHESHPNLPLEP